MLHIYNIYIYIYIIYIIYVYDLKYIYIYLLRTTVPQSDCSRAFSLCAKDYATF